MTGVERLLMLEPPDLAAGDLLAAVRSGYDLPVTTVTFLPIGLDSAAWAYRAETEDGDSYFVKVRRGLPNPAGLMLPRFLRDSGVENVVAPNPALDRMLTANAGEYTVILYPFVEGISGADQGMEERHWVAYGATLRQIHEIAPPAELAAHMRHETFTPPWISAMERLDTLIAAGRFADPFEREVAALWRGRQDEIATLTGRATALGLRLRAAEPPLVICHADIHTWNILIGREDTLWVVDWDDSMLAPRECDLMFVVGGLGRGLVSAREEAWFFEGYGTTFIDPLALAYYRCSRAVDDLRAYAEQVMVLTDSGAATKRHAIEGLLSLFEPGNIVSLAFEADAAVA
jgi:spectinomycin phosphotransferase